jgi:hypothetical protein
MPDRWSRRAPLLGLVFVGLLVATFALSWNTPDNKATGTKIIAYYTSHQSQEQLANVLGAFAVVFWLFFAGSLRDFLRRSGASDGLVSTAFGGAILFGVGGAIFSSLGFALADEPSRLDASSAHALNELSNTFFFPLSAGFAVFAISSAIAILRTRALPVALGWIVLVLGVIAVTPAGFFALFALLVWTAVVSVMTYLRAGQPASAPAVTAPPEPVGAALG